MYGLNACYVQSSPHIFMLKGFWSNVIKLLEGCYCTFISWEAPEHITLDNFMFLLWKKIFTCYSIHIEIYKHLPVLLHSMLCTQVWFHKILCDIFLIKVWSIAIENLLIYINELLKSVDIYSWALEKMLIYVPSYWKSVYTFQLLDICWYMVLRFVLKTNEHHYRYLNTRLQVTTCIKIWLQKALNGLRSSLTYCMSFTFHQYYLDRVESVKVIRMTYMDSHKS